MQRKFVQRAVGRAFPIVRRQGGGLPFRLAALIGALSMSAAPALAQQVAPSRLAPQTLRPQAAPSVDIASPGGESLAAPANAGRLTVEIGKVVVEGGFPELAGAAAALAAGVEGKRVSVAQIYAVANAIEQAYAAAGFVLARVIVPPQKLSRNGALRLIIVDGFVEDIDVKGVPERQRAIVAARMASLIGRRHVQLAEIERRLLLASDVPGIALKSTLARGARSGGTLLVVEATQRYVSGSVGVDNRLPSSLGTWEVNSALAVNSPFGFGEQFYGSATTSYQIDRVFDGDGPLRVLGGGVVLPIGLDGLTLNPEYTNSIARTPMSAGAPATLGEFERFALRANYPVIRTRAQTLNLQVAYEWDEEHLTPIGFPTDLYKDRYQVLRFQGVYNAVLPSGAAAQATGAFSQGLTGRDADVGAATGVPLSRAGAAPTFGKLNLDLRFQQPLPYALQLGVIGRAQTSFGAPLFTAEQFSLDGIDALSAFPAGAFSVDQGATLRAEASRPMTIDFDGVTTSIAPYLFASGGRGMLAMPTAVEQKNISAASVGLGLRTGADFIGAPYGSTFGMEFGRELSDVTAEEQGYRFNLAFAAHF
jgi:hemolysin activation/secretion protein